MHRWGSSERRRCVLSESRNICHLQQRHQLKVLPTLVCTAFQEWQSCCFPAHYKCLRLNYLILFCSSFILRSILFFNITFYNSCITKSNNATEIRSIFFTEYGYSSPPMHARAPFVHLFIFGFRNFHFPRLLLSLIHI